MSEKSEQTRQAVSEAAMTLFRELGYEKTTMRAIAQAAGVSTGNAYYYFSSKDELVQELYSRHITDLVDISEESMAGETTLAGRLSALMHAAIRQQEPYHAFGAGFLSNALKPDSPTFPFGEAAAPTRRIAEDIFRQVVDGSDNVPRRLRETLPPVLGLAHMGLTLFWVYDTTEGRKRTHALIDAAVPLVARAVSLARVPGAGKFVEDGLALVIRARRGLEGKDV